MCYVCIRARIKITHIFVFGEDQEQAEANERFESMMP